MEEERIIRNKVLLRKAEWSLYVQQLRKEVGDKRITDYAAAVQTISDDLKSAVLKRIPMARFAILFSGGIDSLLIAKICKDAGADFMCYTLGPESADDVIVSNKAAQEFGLPLTHILLDKELLQKTLTEVRSFLQTDNQVTLEIACVGWILLSRVKEDIVFSGLGAEEIFAGYSRHMAASNLEEESWRGLEHDLYDKDFLRDVPIAQHFKKTVMTPFLDKQLIIHAMQLPDDFKLKDGWRKFILADVGKRFGLKEFSNRRKKAAQYGSGVNKLIRTSPA